MEDLNEQQNLEIAESDIERMERVFIGNTGEMYLVTDKNGKEYFFKPAQSKDGRSKPYRAYIQEAASKLQQLVSPQTAVQCNTATIRGMFGAIQEKIETEEDSISIYELSSLEMEQLLGEYVVDYCLCNYDSHGRNFLLPKYGLSWIKGIDKEQSFRYIDEPNSESITLNNNYNERYGEDSPVYPQLFERMIWEHRDIIKLIEPYIDRLAQIPDEQYRLMFKQYAQAKSPQGYDILLDKICQRRNFFLEKFQQQIKACHENPDYDIKNDFPELVPYAGKPLTNRIETAKIIGCGGVGVDDPIELCAMAKRIIRYAEFQIVHDKYGRNFLLFTPENGTEMVIQLQDYEKMAEDIEKIVLNLEKAKLNGNAEVTCNSNRTLQITYSENKKSSDSLIARQLGIMYGVLGFDETELWRYYNYIDQLRQGVNTQDAFLCTLKKQFYLDDDYSFSPDQIKKLQPHFRKLENLIGINRQFRLCDIDQILINGKPLVEARDAANVLIQAARREGDHKTIDFVNSSYTPELQDYLLKYLCKTSTELTSEQIKALTFYKNGGFRNINGLLRGDYFEAANETEATCSKLTTMVLQIAQVAESMPTRDYNIFITRIGEGKHNDGEYESFVSFSTGQIRKVSDMGGEPTVEYQMILNRDVPAIPIDALCPESYIDSLSESEMLLLPFRYSTIRSENKYRSLTSEYFDFKEIVQTKQLDVIDILLKRLPEINTKWYFSDEDVKNSIAIVEQAKEKFEQLRAKKLLEQTVQNPQITIGKLERFRNWVNKKMEIIGGFLQRR